MIDTPPNRMNRGLKSLMSVVASSCGARSVANLVLVHVAAQKLKNPCRRRWGKQYHRHPKTERMTTNNAATAV